MYLSRTLSIIESILSNFEPVLLEGRGLSDNDVDVLHELERGNGPAGEKVSSVIQNRARFLRQKMDDHRVKAERAARTGDQPPRAPEVHQDLVPYLETAQTAREERDRVRRTMALANKIDQRKREAEGEIQRLPRFTGDDQKKADDLVDHVARFYRSHHAYQESRDAYENVSSISNKHPELPNLKETFDAAGAELDDAHKSLHHAMSENGIDPRHIERVMQPNLHEIGPRAHMEAVAHFFGGKEHGNGYEFLPGSYSNPTAFLSWAKSVHPTLIPFSPSGTKNIHVRFTRPRPPHVGSLNYKDYVKKFAFEKPEEMAKNRRSLWHKAWFSNSPGEAIDAMIKLYDIALPVRQTKHWLYRLPNGRTWTRSHTPSDGGRGDMYSLRREIKKQHVDVPSAKPESGEQEECVTPLTILVLENIL